MQLVGRAAYGVLADQQLELTRRFARELTADGRWQLVTPVETAIAAVRCAGRPGSAAGELEALQDRIVERVLAGRTHWISATTTVGVRAIRVMVISHLTGWQHLEELIAAMRAAAAAPEST